VRAGHVEAVARPLQVGRTVIVVETEVRDADGRAAAKITQTQAVLRS
jgi:1,4-dihydroxy-2-naphthoyl-CoA hydrolase